MRFQHLLLLLALLPWNGSSQENALRVMSFNIRYPNPDDGLHYWENRRQQVISLIQFHNVDVIGLQEAYQQQLGELAEGLGNYSWFGVCRTDGKMNPDPDNEFSAILYRRDRLEHLDGNTFWLSPTPDEVGTIGWDAALPRIVTWVKFRDKLTGEIFFHFNTHFDHIGAEARMESARLLLLKAHGIAGSFPTILTGDLNCTPEDIPYQILTDYGSPFRFFDALHASAIPHHGPQATYAHDFQVTGLGERRIDYILTKNKWSVLRHAILSDNWNGHFASDHLPVIAHLIID
jgi:endonuclease/exonuclease/phosphatase family metal-dependent hydrolase